MPALWLTNLFDWDSLWQNPWLLLLAAFQLWMLVDAVRRGEWLWAVFIILFPLLNALLYYFLVCRAAPARGLDLDWLGAADRKRIKELEGQIHHLDKAHHYSQLGDLYLRQGKLAKAEGSYRAALQREPEDLDTCAHYGHCLLRQKRAPEALPLLQKVCAQAPTHDYGHSLMALAEAYAGVGQTELAIAAWQRVLEDHSYAQARVQLAELYVAAGQRELARKELNEVVTEDAHAPAFQRRKERRWVSRANALLKRLG